MKLFNKRWMTACVLAWAVISLTGCQTQEVNAVEAAKTGKTATNKITSALVQMHPQVETQVAGNINLLTGMPDLTPEAIGKRPVAVMVNNVRKAFPQYGIEDADVIFEIPVEGGDTRFMALYGD